MTCLGNVCKGAVFFGVVVTSSLGPRVVAHDILSRIGKPVKVRHGTRHGNRGQARKTPLGHRAWKGASKAEIK